MELTKTEEKLFTYLRARPRQWVRPEVLIKEALGTHHKPDSPLVRVHIHSIRKKLGTEAVRLECDPHRQLGYRWNPEE